MNPNYENLGRSIGIVRSISAWISFTIWLAMLPVTAAEENKLAITLGEPEPLPAQLYGFNCSLLAATAFHGITFGGSEMETAVRDLRTSW